MTPETEQQYKNQIAALQAEIEKLKNQQTKILIHVVKLTEKKIELDELQRYY